MRQRDRRPNGHAGTDLAFSPRNNKHLRNWYLTAARSGFYLLDIVRLYRVIARRETQAYDVVIFDRYVYDQIANVYSQSRAAQAYSQLLLRIAPAPDVSFIIDASPAEAFSRKPEYPLEFVHRNRRSFLQLSEIHPRLVVIPPAGVDEVASQIQACVSRSRSVVSVSTTGITETPPTAAVLYQQTFRTAQEDPTAEI